MVTRCCVTMCPDWRMVTQHRVTMPPLNGCVPEHYAIASATLTTRSNTMWTPVTTPNPR